MLIDYFNLLGVNEKSLSQALGSKQLRDNVTKSERLMMRYKADARGVPILQRNIFSAPGQQSTTIMRVDNLVNNCINRNFEADIVDTKIGYMFGYPISYQITGESKAEDTLTAWNRENNVADKDSEIAKTATICGIAHRLLYVDEEGQPKVANLPHDAQVLVVEDVQGVPRYAIHRYQRNELVGNDIRQIDVVDVYDDVKVTTFSNALGSFNVASERPHFFDGCPLYPLYNNEERQGDFEKVLPAIDAYNRTLSDASNEIEQYRLAYLVLRGMGLEEEDVERLKKTGAFELFDADQDVKYLTKDVNNQMIEDHLNRLEENIYKDAKSVDFSDDSFSTAASGISLMYKNQGLENKCGTFERKFVAMLNHQYKLLMSFWAFRGQAESADMYKEINYIFRRNVPIDVKTEAEAALALLGITSRQTAISRLSFIDDTDREIQMIDEERDALSVLPIGDTTSDDND